MTEEECNTANEITSVLRDAFLAWIGDRGVNLGVAMSGVETFVVEFLHTCAGNGNYDRGSLTAAFCANISARCNEEEIGVLQ